MVYLDEIEKELSSEVLSVDNQSSEALRAEGLRVNNQLSKALERFGVNSEMFRGALPLNEVFRVNNQLSKALRVEGLRVNNQLYEALRAMTPYPEALRANRRFSEHKKKLEIKAKRPETPKSDEIKSLEISFKIEIKEPTEEQNSYFSSLGERRKEQLLFIEKVIKDMGVYYLGDGDKKAIYEECDKKRPNFLGSWGSFCKTWVDLNKSGKGIPELSSFKKSTRVCSK